MRNCGARRPIDLTAALGVFKRIRCFTQRLGIGFCGILADRFFPVVETRVQRAAMNGNRQQQTKFWTVSENAVLSTIATTTLRSISARYEPAEENQEVINRRVAPVQARAVRSRRNNGSAVDRNDVPGDRRYVGSRTALCIHNASNEAA